MELRQLRYFDALARSLNFTRAAERLHVTQSTLSHQIRQLESELGVQLFDRRTRRVSVTEAGEALRGYVSDVLERLDEGLLAMQANAKAFQGSVRMGATSSMNAAVVPACVAAFMERYPGIQVTVEELPANAIEARLVADELDLGISYEPAANPDLWFERLLTEELHLIVSKKHPMAGRKRVRMIELHGAPLVLLPPRYQTRRMIDACFDIAGARPQIVAHVDAAAPTLELIRRRPIAGILAPSLVVGHHDLRAISLEDPVPVRTPGMLWRKGATRSPVIRYLAQLLREAIKSSRSK